MTKTSSSAQRLAVLFAGFTGAHGTHGEPRRAVDALKWEIKSTARTIREPVTEDMWDKHVKGDRPLGVIPIREDGTCVWASIDIDEYGDDLHDVVEGVYRRKLPLIPCRSKSGGLHLFMFFTDPTPAEQVVGVLRDLSAQLGWAGCEIFPKQTQVLVDRGDLGSWMLMPYFGGTYGGKLLPQVGLKQTGAEMVLSEFLRVAEGARLSVDDLVALTTTAASSRSGTKKSKKQAEPFADGPPCLQHLSSAGVAEHQGRNAALLMAAIYLKRKHPSEWKSRLEEHNQSWMRPPLPAEEVSGVVHSVERREYDYTCKVEPMASHCNSAVCRTRKWGVGAEGNVPKIQGISKLDVPEDPVWFVDVDDGRVELSSADLQTYRRFHLACMQQLNRCYVLMKEADWLTAVSVAMQDLEVIEPPPDVGAPERFREMLEEYLTNRLEGERREDLLLGKPWEDQEAGRHYFVMRYFMEFAQREGVKDLKRVKVSRYVDSLGGGRHFFNIRGTGVNCYWVPTSVISRAPDVEPGQVPGVPI